MTTNLSTLSRLSMADFRAKLANVTKTFDYATPLVSLPIFVSPNPGQPANPATITINGDANFVAVSMAGRCLIAASGLPIVPELHAEPEVQLISQDSGRQLMNRPIRWRNIVGTARRPFRFSAPYVFERGTTVTVNLFNYETTIYLVQITLHGYKVF